MGAARSASLPLVMSEVEGRAEVLAAFEPLEYLFHRLLVWMRFESA